MAFSRLMVTRSICVNGKLSMKEGEGGGCAAKFELILELE
jgi:hypothetical protein